MTDLLKNLQKISLRAIGPLGRRPELYRKLPESAGIYVFLNAGLPIYIGKAINLKRRVSSYFDLNLEIKTASMIKAAQELSYIQVASELEALLLEARLIRTSTPKYNIAAKDDKHPLYIQITKERYPRVITARKIAERQKNIAFYGPFPSSNNVRLVLRMLRRIFPYSDHKLGKRGCLYSHIGLCNPCPNEIVQRDSITSWAQYKVLRKVYLKNIRSIKAILDGKIGKLQKDLEKEMKKASFEQNFEKAAGIRDQIEKIEYITRPQIPTEFYMQNPNLYEDIRHNELFELKNLLTRFLLVTSKLNRIECYDVAHLSGTNATASMVTFIAGSADKTFYRHFRIRQVKGNSDIDSLKEVITRRLKHIDDWGRPDLIIVDGGIAQVRVFTNMIYIMLVDIPVVGIAKNPDRLIVGNTKIRLEGNALHLVSRIRDEAHRFARRYHHMLVSKALIY
ncbi:MAG: UvrB/UvrC motif-containing protein [Candidatus Woesebacteria bacterium]|nr:UvrB/UvrC motif-containing protein [Candidatus Woesebacteria bacterium]